MVWWQLGTSWLCCRMLWCQPSLELQDPREISPKGEKKGEGAEADSGITPQACELTTWLLCAQEGDQTEGPCPVPYYLYLVKYKHWLSRFNHKLQPGPKTFPNKSIIKRTPITLVWDVICQTEGSQPLCVNNNELISLERIKYWLTCYLLTPFNSLLSNSIGWKYFNLCTKGFLNNTGSHARAFLNCTMQQQANPCTGLRHSVRQQKLQTSHT